MSETPESSGPVKKDQVPTPTVTFTTQALSQLRLIVENDFTLGGKYFRLLISGKGCDGFTYSAGFTDKESEDLEVPVESRDQKLQNIYGSELQVLMDPFTAFYLQHCTVDYVQDFENDTEGFTVTNHRQRQFAGKFWRRDESKIPPVKEDTSN